MLRATEILSLKRHVHTTLALQYRGLEDSGTCHSLGIVFVLLFVLFLKLTSLTYSFTKFIN